MKKITLLLGLAFLAFSCSSDDDGGSSPEDLIGAWQFTERTIDGIQEELDSCQQMGILIFSEDILTQTFFFEDASENCVSDGVDMDSYEATSDTIIITFLEDGEEEMVVVDYSINGSELTISFEQEEDVEDEDGNLVRDEDGNRRTEIVNFTDVYIRVTE